MTQGSVMQHPSSVEAYIRHGWKLVPIPKGTKGPDTRGWNKLENALTEQSVLPPGFGIGLAHAYSGTMALDIDNWETAEFLLGIKGIDINHLYDAPDAVIIDSGKAGHGKLLYAMPFTMPTKKVSAGDRTSYELRCATATGLTVQDVLPPSIHPETNQPYRWAGKGHWSRLPPIPEALLMHWNSLLADDHLTVKREKAQSEVDTPLAEVEKALSYINADCDRDIWINVGMALHLYGNESNQSEEAFALWDEWSKTAPERYPGEREIRKQWTSFREDRLNLVTLGTLFNYAKRAGWTPQTRPLDIEKLFANKERITLSPYEVMEGLAPPPPSIDLDLWPAVLATRAKEVSVGIGCDPLIPLFAGLGAVCGVVDARIRLELMPGFKVPPVLWLLTIGSPADKKSPGSRPMMSALKDIELEDRPRYQRDLLAWEAQEAMYASAKKAFLEHAGSADAMLNSPAPDVPNLPPRPVPLKITCTDITSQKLVRSSADRPRGLLCYLDETNQWVRKVTERNSGEDRSAWVSGYESERYEMERVGAGSIHCDNYAISIFGNMQPGVFSKHCEDLSIDGMIQRFIPAIIRPNSTKLGQPIPDELTTAPQWEMLLRTVFSLPVTTYRLSPDAYEKYREFQKWYEGRKQDEYLLMANDHYMLAFGKLEGLTGRLCLMFHIMENPFAPMVEAHVVERVVNIVKNYIIPVYRHAFSFIGPYDNFSKWLIDHIIHIYDRGTVPLSELKRAGRRHLNVGNSWVADQIVISAMELMEKKGWVIRMDDGSEEHRHIASWALNPALGSMFKDYRARVSKARREIFGAKD